MQRVTPVSFPDFFDNAEDSPAPRLALAGGSDRRPPDDGQPRQAEIIEFPRRPPAPDSASEGLRPWPGEPAEKPGGPDQSAREALAGEQSLWPHWMAHVLTRYRGPAGGESGPGVFL